MPIVKVGRSRQVTIPKKIFEEMALEAGDYFEVYREEDRIVLCPKKLVDKSALWYWSREGQAAIRESLEDKKAGRVYGPYETAEEALKALDQLGDSQP